MTERSSRTGAIAETVVVLAASLTAVILVARSPLGEWERSLLGRPYLEYVALAIIPVAAILIRREPLADYGLDRRDLADQMDSSFRCAFAFAVGKALLFPLGPRGVLHSFVEPAVVVCVVLASARLVRLPARASHAALVLALPFTPPLSVAPLVFYPFVLAPAEELVFRGYIQSRLNFAFARPLSFLGAGCGWGVLIAAGLFSIFHVINLPALSQGRLDIQWQSAVPTFAWGLALGYLRERSGGLLVPTVCHGVPQALAWAFLGR